MKKFNPKILAFYLPQFHPIKENNDNFGEGFTEWTNVAKAKPLFKGHVQPKIPADLGFYDLRLPEVRNAQAKLAKEAGITAFCYYHYWFGNGQVVMEKPINEVVRLGEPDFPFCLCWANHTWYKKSWNPSLNSTEQKLLFEQKYLGEKDIIDQFYYLLPIFKDKRYYRINGKLVYVIYDVEIPNSEEYWSSYMKIWNQLAKANDLPEFYYIAYNNSPSNITKPLYKKFDKVMLSLVQNSIGAYDTSLLNRAKNKVKMFFAKKLRKALYVKSYKAAMNYFLHPICKEKNVVPVMVPNWDYTPRVPYSGLILHNATPELFKKHIQQTFDLILDKPAEDQIVFIKSWNEWGEGNYMEPDQQFGKGYIYALRDTIEQYKIQYNK